jgi:hypothetical protein
MKRVPEVLEFPVVVEGNRPPSREPQALQKRNLVRGGIAAERGIVEKLFEPWL